MKRVVILLFSDVEVLDCCGPFEVFATSKDAAGVPCFEVLTVAERLEAVRAVGGLLLQPHHALEDCPDADVLVVPGGAGRKREMHNRAVIDWIRQRAPRAELVLSVCTGAFLLGQAGLLDGLAATTHFSAHEELEEMFPSVHVERSERFVDNGKIVTSAGIAAGIDASLHVVRRLCGEEISRATARRMEYTWEPGERK